MANGLSTTGFLGGLAQGIGQAMLMRTQRKQREEQRKLQEQILKANLRLTEIRTAEAERKQLAEAQMGSRLSGAELPPEQAGPTQPSTTLAELVKTDPQLFLRAGATPQQLLKAEHTAAAPERNREFLEMVLGGGAPIAPGAPTVTPAGAPGAGVETLGPAGEALPSPAGGAAPGRPQAASGSAPEAQEVGQLGAGQARLVPAAVTLSPTGQPQVRFERNRPVGRPFPVRTPDGGFVNVQRWLDGPPTAQDLPPNMQSIDVPDGQGGTVRVFRDVAPRSQPGAAALGAPGEAIPVGGAPGAVPRGTGTRGGLGAPGTAIGGGVRVKEPAATVQAREFVPATELQNLRVIDRETQRLRAAPVQMQRGELNDQDFVRVTPAQSTKLETLDAAINVLEQLRGNADKVFTAKAGLLQRAFLGGQQAYERLLQTDPDLVLYSQQSQGFLGVLARAAASEKGPLNEGDVRRAGKIVPRLVTLGGPDTEEVASRKLAALDRLLKSQYNTVLGRQVFDIAPLTDLEVDSIAPTPPDDPVLRQVESALETFEQGFIEKSDELIKGIWNNMQRTYDGLKEF